MARRASQGRRALRTVLFTDIVGSTELATQLGDRTWRDLLGRHHARLRRALRQHGGREVDTAGDGFFAVFAEPGEAIRSALMCIEAVRDLGIELRAGLHIGETEEIDGKAGGVAVHIAARVMALAGAGEVLVTGTLADLAMGGDLEFEDRGSHQLKGVPGTWRVLRVMTRTPIEHAVVNDDGAWRPSRRLLAALAIAGALVLVIAAGAAFLLGRQGPPGGVSAGPNTIARIDPLSNGIADTIRVGTGPTALAGGGAAIWVANLDDRTVSRVDPANRLEVVRPGGVGVPTSVAVAEGSAWVADVAGALYVIDGRTNQVVRVFEGVAAGSAIAAGEGAVWVLDSIADRVVRVDPRTRQISATIDIPEGSGSIAIAAGEGGIWVANRLNNTLTRIDPEAAQVVVARIALCCRPSSVSVGGGYVWVASQESDRVSRITPATNSATLTLEVGDAPAGVAADENATWVANGLASTLSRFDSSNQLIATVDLPAQPTALLLVDGSLWVALRASSR